MTNSIFKEDGSIDVEAMQNAAKQITAAKEAEVQNKKFNKKLQILNDALKYDFFCYDRFLQAILDIEGLDSIVHGTKEQKAISEYLLAHNLIGYKKMSDEKFNELMTLVVKAMPSGRVSFDVTEQEFYRTGEVSPSEIAAIRAAETQKFKNGIQGWWFKKFEQFFG